MGASKTPTMPSTQLGPEPQVGKEPDPKNYPGGKNDPQYLEAKRMYESLKKQHTEWEKLKKAWDEWNAYQDKQLDALDQLEQTNDYYTQQQNAAYAGYNESSSNQNNANSCANTPPDQWTNEQKQWADSNGINPEDPNYRDKCNSLSDEYGKQADGYLKDAAQAQIGIDISNNGIAAIANGQDAEKVAARTEAEIATFQAAGANYDGLTEETRQYHIEQAKNVPKESVEPFLDQTVENDFEGKNFATDPVNNFRLPEWGYENFVQELDSFRKGLTSLTGEPGWFYFKIFFHFDDNYGLLAEALTNSKFILSGGSDVASISDSYNSAVGYLIRRSNISKFASSNLKPRAIMLCRFIQMLSKINIDSPWFFDKITGLDKAGIVLDKFTEDKIIEISCLEDAIDMRLTTLFHLYQYACYDEIWQKEIVPENLRKFNMSIMLYHIPITYHNTSALISSNDTNTSTSIKSNLGEGLTFGNRMSYKLYTFKGCEFDLQSMFGVVPGSIDNAKPFNLGKNSIRIKYDKCYTHLMNEWEQIMLGADGIYYDPKNQIETNASLNFVNKLHSLIKASDNPNNIKLYDKLLANSFLKSDHALGNIYNLDIQKLKHDSMMQYSRGVYLANLFDYNPVLFRGLVLQRNVAPDKQVFLTSMYKNDYGVWTSVNSFKKIGHGMGYRRLPNVNNLNSVIGTGVNRQKYINMYIQSKKYNGMPQTENFTSVYQSIEDGILQKRYQYGTLYAIEDYHISLRNIVDSYTNAWQNITGFWKSMVNNVKGTINALNPKNAFNNTFGNMKNNLSNTFSQTAQNYRNIGSSFRTGSFLRF